MTTVIICGGGPRNEWMSLQPYSSQENMIFIGADRGAFTLLEMGIKPNKAVGDFDSLTADEFSQLQQSIDGIQSVAAEKDETDAELAIIQALTYNPNEIVITGVTGGRLDHFMAVMNSVYHFQLTHPMINFKIVNKWNEMILLVPGEHELLINKEYTYISFFAFQGPITEVTLKGFKYNVDGEMIELGNSRFTSNELIHEVGSISFASGICLVIRSSDE